ncbi:MAG: ATP-binding cassette domain-containing protein, partial [Chloroflexota bacterium]|nr:ATP-binding cassette domain-containing protein [Chloroflexota bacterium]
MTDRPIHLEVRGLGKSFGATRALDDVSVTIHRGTVHAFVGENGAGKSTLGKIIAGLLPPDQGDLILQDAAVAFRSPREALDRGIAIVAQEVALVPQLTVAQNVFLGAEPRRAGFIDRAALQGRFVRLAADAGFALDGRARVGDLPLAAQQQVEILRSLGRAADLI